VPAEHGHSHNKRTKAINDFRKSIKKETTKEFTVQKIWVCGPPFMSDNFDKDLTSLINERDDELQRKVEKKI
jgi:predicted ferric reductase